MVEVALAIWRPAQITALRVLLAGLVLLVAALAGRHALPRDLRRWGFFLAIAIVGNAMPFFLISWGQQHVESGLAGILAACTPLVALVLAHYSFEDERLSWRHFAAFGLGFGGVIVLVGPDSFAALGGSSARLLGQLSVLGGAVCYAIATVLARLIPPTHPVVTAAGVMLVGSAIMSPFGWAGLQRFPEMSLAAGAAIGFLGLLGTGSASILYFYLVPATGVRFASYLNYLVPVWAVGLGTLILGESVPLTAWVALVLILSGLAMSESARGRG
jgi:drug/metabolite transporter (DMT)-like permease